MFKVRITPKAKDDLKKLPGDAFYTVSQDILSLEKNHSPDGHRIKKIELVKGFYRLRTGSYRSVFYVSAPWIVIVTVAHRRDWEKTLKNLF